MISIIIIPYKIAIEITSKFIEPLKKSFSTRRNKPKNKRSPPINQSLGLLNSTRIKGKTNIKKPTARNKYPKTEISIFLSILVYFEVLEAYEEIKIMSQAKKIQKFSLKNFKITLIYFKS
tara:strand:- start:399 stop:758 length:360 start_codon:yes stop_codon:yes gene_type:complete